MSEQEYGISQVYPGDRRTMGEVEKLLHAEGIRLDPHLDYTCAMSDSDGRVIGTGSCFGNTLRCFAVSREHQGEGLMNQIISHLIQVQYERGNLHLFLYTKCDSAKFFGDLGFYEIARVEEQNLVFMENRRTGFADYLKALENASAGVPSAPPAETAAVVMNANPFTLGHRYLVEKAAAENQRVHLFMVSEDASLVPFRVREKLVREGTADLGNLIYHESGPYIISSATFPSYFQKDAESVIRGHALLDITVFIRIARALGIGRRYVGEEPRSLVTGIYNDVMKEKLPEAGIGCRVIPRKEAGGEVISASTARQALKDGDLETFRKLVPETTYAYFTSPEAEPVLRRIRGEKNVIHY